MLDRYRATFIGLIFTGGCLLLYYTFIVPLLIMLPLSLTLESIFNSIYDEYSAVGSGIIVTLTIIFIALSAGFFINFHRQLKDSTNYKSTQVILYMSLILFVVHPLVFYIDLSKDWSRANDGQFILTTDQTFQLSSWSFVILGFGIDCLKLGKQKHSH